MPGNSMRAVFVESLGAQCKPMHGLRVLLFGFSGRGFPGGDGVAEAVEWLPQFGLEVTYTHLADPCMPAKLGMKYDVAIICQTRIANTLKAPPTLWTCAPITALWFWDLRPAKVAMALRGKITHAFLTYNGKWKNPQGELYDPWLWAQRLDCRVGYCPQGSSLKEPVLGGAGHRVVFVGDLANKVYHQGRATIARELGAKVVNARKREQRLQIESRLPELYASSSYCLAMSPLAPGYTSVRTYSILGCGGLLMQHRFPGADRLFDDECNAILFDSTRYATQRMAELDSDLPRRQRMAHNGRKLHAARDTVSHRVANICRQTLGLQKGFFG